MTKRVYLLNRNEFIVIMALLMSITALSIDAMIPALGQISTDLNVADPNATQWVISSIFLGISFGVMLYGPFADSFGRKTAIYLGVFIFLVGTLVAVFATTLKIMLIGRAIQGFGSASCRVVSITIIRDKYEGREMAQIMSLIMMVFILVPALAPLLGQGILLFSTWQAIFWFILIFALVSVTWMHFRQRETLSPLNKRVFSIRLIISGIVDIVKNQTSLGYTLASGIMFGAFVSYLSTAQQILAVQYGLGMMFPVYFGILALAYGVSSFLNSKLLNTYSIQQISRSSLILQVVISILFLGLSIAADGNLNFTAFFIYMLFNFFCLGPLFGNFNSLALQPFGHMAGLATSVISAIQTLTAVLVGGLIGQMYDGTVEPIIAGYFGCGITTLLIFLTLQRHKS